MSRASVGDSGAKARRSGAMWRTLARMDSDDGDTSDGDARAREGIARGRGTGWGSRDEGYA